MPAFFCTKKRDSTPLTEKINSLITQLDRLNNELVIKRGPNCTSWSVMLAAMSFCAMCLLACAAILLILWMAGNIVYTGISRSQYIYDNTDYLDSLEREVALYSSIRDSAFLELLDSERYISTTQGCVCPDTLRDLALFCNITACSRILENITSPCDGEISSGRLRHCMNIKEDVIHYNDQVIQLTQHLNQLKRTISEYQNDITDHFMLRQNLPYLITCTGIALVMTAFSVALISMCYRYSTTHYATHRLKDKIRNTIPTINTEIFNEQSISKLSTHLMPLLQNHSLSAKYRATCRATLLLWLKLTDPFPFMSCNASFQKTDTDFIKAFITQVFKYANLLFDENHPSDNSIIQFQANLMRDLEASKKSRKNVNQDFDEDTHRVGLRP